jgi:hypothetical protein
LFSFTAIVHALNALAGKRVYLVGISPRKCMLTYSHDVAYFIPNVSATARFVT